MAFLLFLLGFCFRIVYLSDHFIARDELRKALNRVYLRFLFGNNYKKLNIFNYDHLAMTYYIFTCLYFIFYNYPTRDFIISNYPFENYIQN